MAEEDNWIDDEKEIDCADCDAIKAGHDMSDSTKWVSCEPVPGKPGRCLAKWKFKG